MVPMRATAAAAHLPCHRCCRFPCCSLCSLVETFTFHQTGFTTDPRPKYNYEARRRALRASWFPGSQQELAR